MITPLLGWLAAGFTLCLAWPQVWLSCVRGRTNGLSATACWLAVALSAAWLTYGALLHDAAQITTNVVVLVANTAILVTLLSRRPALRRPRVLARTAWGAFAMLAVSIGSAVGAALPGLTGAGVAAPFGSLVSTVAILAALPQPMSLLGDRTQDTSGISLPRWLLSITTNSLWLAYGVASAEPAVWASSVIGLCCALVVCHTVRSARARHRELVALAGLHVEPAPTSALAAADVALAA